MLARTFEPRYQVLINNSYSKLFSRNLKVKMVWPFHYGCRYPLGALKIQDEAFKNDVKVNAQRLKHYFDGGIDREKAYVCLKDTVP